MLARTLQQRSSWWQIALVTLLAAASGCSGAPQPAAGELIPILGSRGGITYRFESAKSATGGTNAASPARLDDWLRQVVAEAKDRQRRSALAYADMRREREEQFRQQQREIQAYESARQQFLRDQRAQQQEMERDYRQRLGEWTAAQRLTRVAEPAHWERLSQSIDASFQALRSTMDQQAAMRRLAQTASTRP
jgi:hypothetical protein